MHSHCYIKKLLTTIFTMLYLVYACAPSKTAYGINILITPTCVYYMHYQFSPKESLRIGQYEPLDTDLGRIPKISKIRALIFHQIYTSPIFKKMKIIPNNFVITITTLQPNYPNEMISAETLTKLKGVIKTISNISYENRGGTKIMQMFEISKKRKTIMTMEYLNWNYDLENKVLLTRNVVSFRGNGISLMFSTKNENLSELNQTTLETYYIKFDSTHAIFSSQVYCYTAEKIQKLTNYFMIINQERLIEPHDNVVYDHPCYTSEETKFNITPEDSNHECFRDILESTSFKQSYVIRGAYNYAYCELLIRVVLLHDIKCINIPWCWLSLKSEIYAKPLGNMLYFDGAYGKLPDKSAPINFVALSGIVQLMIEADGGPTGEYGTQKVYHHAFLAAALKHISKIIEDQHKIEFLYDQMPLQKTPTNIGVVLFDPRVTEWIPKIIMDDFIPKLQQGK